MAGAFDLAWLRRLMVSDAAQAHTLEGESRELREESLKSQCNRSVFQC